jgi:TolA-binding protein
MNARICLLAAWILAVGFGVARGQSPEAETEPPRRLSSEEASLLLATGRAAYEDGLYGLASRRLEELMAAATDRRRAEEAALWLARVRVAEDRPEEALSVLDEHSGGLRNAALLADYAAVRAAALMRLGRIPEAASELGAFRDRHLEEKSAPGALRLLAQAHAQLGDWSGARETVALLEERFGELPDAPAAALDLARELRQAGRIAEARGLLAQVEKGYAGQIWSERAAVQTAEIQLSQGERPQAMSRLQSLTTNAQLSAETRAMGYRIVAQAFGSESNYAAAVEMIDRGIAASADPAQRLESEILKARLLLMADRIDEGRQLMREVASRVPDGAHAAHLQAALADSLLRMGRWSDAAAEYQVWLDAFDGAPGTSEALAGRGWALWHAKRYEESAAAFARAAAVETNGALRLPLLQKVADAQFASGQYTGAKAAYAAVLEAPGIDDETAGRVKLQLAETELALGNAEAGELLLLELSRARRETAFSRAATLRLGALYEERGALETASEQYGRIVDSCADADSCAQALLARGLIRYRMGSFQAAFDDFTRIRSELPQTPPAPQAMFMRGWCLYLLGKDDEALAACERFLADYPGSQFVPDVMVWLAEIAFNHGEYEKAERRFLAVAQQHPDSPRAADALFWAGRSATARRAYLAANEHYNALMARHPESPRLAETLLAQGDVLSELGQFAAAILAYDEVIVRFPQSAESMVAWGRKGDCQYTLGQETPARYEEALLSYRTLLDFARTPMDLRLQAGFKIGRCLEKMGRAAAALDHYMEVAYSYLQETRPPAAATVWFTRSAFAAAALQERAGKWREAVGIYGRVADSGVPAAAEAADRMRRIRNDHWILF